MSPKASDLAARMAATAVGARPTAPAPGPTAPSAPSESSLSHIQRFTINLPKAQHRFIRQFALASDTDVSTIIRLLLSRIESDPVFAEEVRSLIDHQQ